MGSTQLEVERKYDVPQGAAVPPLAGVGPVATVDEPVPLQLEAVYHDTADLALARSRTTLRRRTGGEDSGWHLKRPQGTARSERHEPLGEADGPVPEVLLDEVRALVRDHPVEPVATLRTRRVVHRLRNRDGAVLAELADDTVTAHSVGEDGAATVDSWREWEVELVEGDPGLFEELAGALPRGRGGTGRRAVQAGARPGRSAGGDGRARGARAVPPRRGGPGGPGPPPGPSGRGRRPRPGRAGRRRGGRAQDARRDPATAQRPADVPPAAGPRRQRAAARRADLARRRRSGRPATPR